MVSKDKDIPTAFLDEATIPLSRCPVHKHMHDTHI